MMNNNLWNNLSMRDRAAWIKFAVANGIRDTQLMASLYNEYKNGGHLFEDGGDSTDDTSVKQFDPLLQNSNTSMDARNLSTLVSLLHSVNNNADININNYADYNNKYLPYTDLNLRDSIAALKGRFNGEFLNSIIDYYGTGGADDARFNKALDAYKYFHTMNTGTNELNNNYYGSRNASTLQTPYDTTLNKANIIGGLIAGEGDVVTNRYMSSMDDSIFNATLKEAYTPIELKKYYNVGSKKTQQALNDSLHLGDKMILLNGRIVSLKGVDNKLPVESGRYAVSTPLDLQEDLNTYNNFRLAVWNNIIKSNGGYLFEDGGEEELANINYKEYGDNILNKLDALEFMDYMDKLAIKKSELWISPMANPEDIELLKNDMIDDSTYDYFLWFKDNKKDAKEMLLEDSNKHFPDTYKTLFHPTFSNESIYSKGYKNYENDSTLEGGHWDEKGNYILSKDLINNNWDIRRSAEYLQLSDPGSKVIYNRGDLFLTSFNDPLVYKAIKEGQLPENLEINDDFKNNEEVKDFIENDILKRNPSVKRKINKSLKEDDIGTELLESGIGGFFNNYKKLNRDYNNDILLNALYPKNASTFLHELTHSYRLGLNPEMPDFNNEYLNKVFNSGYDTLEYESLDKSYKFSKNYKLDYDPVLEKGATNTEIRFKLYEDLKSKLKRSPTVKELNDYILNYNEEDLWKIIKNINGYGLDFYRNRDEVDVDQLKSTIINVASNNNTTSLNNNIYMASNGGKLYLNPHFSKK